MIEILSASEIELMREAGRRAAATLYSLQSIMKPGVSTFAIDEFVRRSTAQQGCTPAPLGYRGAFGHMPPFPAACCTSVNNVVCHGIPDDKQVLHDGDIVNVDVTHIYQGFHGDTSRMFCIGKVTPTAKELVDACYQALLAGIAEVKPGARLGDIGAAIELIAKPRGFSVVEDYVGHGIGRKFHTNPDVKHFGTRGMGMRLRPGMCFTIEPMLNEGTPETKLLDDGWTAVTEDGRLSAQWEHTILVTETGHEVLTASPVNIDSDL